MHEGRCETEGTNTLLTWAEREDQPLRSCPDEIQNVTKIGRPMGALLAGEELLLHGYHAIVAGTRS